MARREAVDGQHSRAATREPVRGRRAGATAPDDDDVVVAQLAVGAVASGLLKGWDNAAGSIGNASTVRYFVPLMS